MIDASDLIDELKDRYVREGIKAGRDSAVNLWLFSDMIPEEESFQSVLESMDVDYVARHVLRSLDERGIRKEDPRPLQVYTPSGGEESN